MGYFSRRQIGNIFLFFQENKMGDNLHEMSDPLFSEKIRKNIYFRMSSAENFT